MFNSKLVVALKTAGKVLREQGDKVYLPFGSEYSIFLKNLNSVRALVRVELDGKSVTDGEELVIYGNSSLDLERFLKKGNMESGNRFKFIERTSKVEAHRGIEAEDGILRVEFQFEKVQPKTVTETIVHKTIHKYEDVYCPYKPYYPYKPYWMGPFYNYTMTGSNNTSCNVSSAVGSSDVSFSATSPGVNDSNLTRSLKSASVNFTKSAAPVVEAQSINDAGITVAGSVSDQKFQHAQWFDVEDTKHVIVLKLLGEVGGQTVETPILVRHQQTCSTCGTRNRGKLAQFCRECGTALELVGESPKRRKVVGVKG